MSQKLSLSLCVDNAIAVIMIMGIILVVGSLIILSVGTIIDHNFLFTSLGAILPLIIVGILCIGIGAKLLEWLK